MAVAPALEGEAALEEGKEGFRTMEDRRDSLCRVIRC